MDRHPHRAVVGAGQWGTTLALHLAKLGPVILLARDEEQARELAAGPPQQSLPARLHDPRGGRDHGRSRRARATRTTSSSSPCPPRRCATRPNACARTCADTPVLLSVAKGIEHGTLMRMTEVLADELPDATGRIAAMSGPNLALEIAQRPAGLGGDRGSGRGGRRASDRA